MEAMLRNKTDHLESNSPPLTGRESVLGRKKQKNPLRRDGDLPRFDPQLRLGVAEKAQVDDFARRDFARDFVAAPGLLDDELQAVFGDGAVGVEQIPQRVV